MNATSTLANTTTGNNNTAPIDEFYAYYKDRGCCVELIAPVAHKVLVAIAGIIMNASVIYVTWRARSSLHGTTNYLLALTCLFEVLHQPSHFWILSVTVSCRNFVTYGASVYAQLVPIAAVDGALMAIMLTALDRLIGVIVPIWHRNVNKPLYLGFFTALALGYGLYTSYFALTMIPKYGANMISGYIADVLTYELGDLWFQVCMLLNLISVLFYIAIWVMLRQRKGASTAMADRVVKSLVLILGVNVGGYLITAFTNVIIIPRVNNGIVGNTVPSWFLRFACGTLLNIGAAANAPILYAFSAEYRSLYRREFPWLFRQTALTHAAKRTATAALTGGGSSGDGLKPPASITQTFANHASVTLVAGAGSAPRLNTLVH